MNSEVPSRLCRKWRERETSSKVVPRRLSDSKLNSKLVIFKWFVVFFKEKIYLREIQKHYAHGFSLCDNSFWTKGEGWGLTFRLYTCTVLGNIFWNMFLNYDLDKPGGSWRSSSWSVRWTDTNMVLISWCRGMNSWWKRSKVTDRTSITQGYRWRTWNASWEMLW